MTRALIVTLDISDPSELPSLAEEITNELVSMGLPVVSVKPWDAQDQGSPFNAAVEPPL